RVSETGPPYADLEPVAAAIVAAFGVEGCIWGSDWPFINLPRRPDYGGALAALARWLPDKVDRDRVLWANPVRLLGFSWAMARPVRVAPAGAALRLLGPRPRVAAFDFSAGYQASFDAAIRHFVDGLRRGAPFETDIVDNLETLRLVDDAYAAAAR